MHEEYNISDHKLVDSNEIIELQSRLITYIQNAYLSKEDYVQEEDLQPLKDVWNELIVYLIRGDAHGQHRGLIAASPSAIHEILVEFYKSFNVLSLTTNFDNLLYKAFKEQSEGQAFYPILDVDEFDRYICSDESDKSCIEIQSRGDVFWIECTGNKKKICAQRKKKCLVPDKRMIGGQNGRILCPYCESDANVYFAFPGTKEKDEEMTSVIDKIWKYFANSIGEIIIIGSSMDYDPVFVGFIREMISRRNIPIMYISRLREKDEIKEGFLTSRNFFEDEIEKCRATRFLFGEHQGDNITWVRSKNTEDVLKDIYSLATEKTYCRKEVSDWETKRKAYRNRIENFYEKLKDYYPQLLDSKEVYSSIMRNDHFLRLKCFSQLGLKTYWKSGNVNCLEHNRYNHSIGVMLIATRLYLDLKKEEADDNELDFLMLATLLHDIGHLPFSHLLEEVFDELGWIPQGENRPFNHEYYSRKIIDKMEELQPGGILDNIGYSKDDIKRLISGEYGVGYLDAIVNSPCDSDKIEYVHADAIRLGRGEVQNINTFIDEFASDISINSENMLAIKGNSTISFIHLIRMRSDMYDEVYNRRGLRFLEACCKMIIQIFIVYKTACINELINVKEDFYDLSDKKIEMVIEYIEGLIKGYDKSDEISELFILEHMVSEIENNPIISSSIKGCVKKCYEWIVNTKGEEAIKELEKNNIESYELNKENLSKHKKKDMIKDLYLRFPGVVLVDYVEKTPAFSYGKRGDGHRREDGTNSEPENILIKDINQSSSKEEYICLGDAEKKINERLNIVVNGYIHIYRITDNRFLYMQAVDFIRHKLLEEGIII